MKPHSGDGQAHEEELRHAGGLSDIIRVSGGTLGRIGPQCDCALRRSVYRRSSRYILASNAGNQSVTSSIGYILMGTPWAGLLGRRGPVMAGLMVAQGTSG